MGVKIYNWLTEELSKEKTITAKDQDTACLIGLRSRVYQFQPVEKLKAETDFKYRRWHRQWWIQVRNIMKILSQHESTYTYTSEGEFVGVEEDDEKFL